MNKQGQWVIFHCIDPLASSSCNLKQFKEALPVGSPVITAVQQIYKLELIPASHKVFPENDLAIQVLKNKRGLPRQWGNET